jgi:hypothetical protein
MTLALRYYNGGFKQSNWGSQNAAYAGGVYDFAGRGGAGVAGTGGGSYMPSRTADAFNPNAAPTFGFGGPQIQLGRGESPESVQLKLAQDMLASRGLNLQQLQMGQLTKGDVSWAGSQAMTQLVNSRTSLQQTLKNPALTGYAKGTAANDLRDVDKQIANLQNFMPTMMAKAREGGRQVTIGDPRININVGGVTDPKELARQIRVELQKNLTQLVNEYGTAGNA